MKLLDVVGYAVLAFLLVVVAVAISTMKLWTGPGNHTLPWLCVTLAVALLVVATVCYLVARGPEELPILRAGAFYALAVIGVAIGLTMDSLAMADSYSPELIVSSVVVEGLGFAGILAAVMFLPRLKRLEQSKETGARSRKRDSK